MASNLRLPAWLLAPLGACTLSTAEEGSDPVTGACDRTCQITVATCPGNSLRECTDDCTASYTDYDSCIAELDAFYACTERQSGADFECRAGRAEIASPGPCDAQSAALRDCVSSS